MRYGYRVLGLLMSPLWVVIGLLHGANWESALAGASVVGVSLFVGWQAGREHERDE